MTRDDIEGAYPWSPHAGARARQRQRIDRIEDYLFIGADHISTSHAAARLGVTTRSIARYRAVLRATTGGTAS